jgi:hypothetical protein
MDDDYPTYASTEPVFPWDYILHLPPLEEMRERHEAEEAAKAEREAARYHKEETNSEISNRIEYNNQQKAVKSAKASAKKLVKAKKIRKVSSYYKKSK